MNTFVVCLLLTCDLIKAQNFTVGKVNTPIQIIIMNNELKENDSYSSEFRNCSKVTFRKEEFHFLNNNTISIPIYKKVYNDSWYRIEGEDVVVCQLYFPTFVSYMAYITFVGLGISIFCLILHLILLLYIPYFRNTAGRNLASLVLSLLVAFSAFLVGESDFISPSDCNRVAVVTYYFFLASLFWMNVLALDVFRTIRLGATEFRVVREKQWQRFLVYSLYAWVSPLAIVIFAVVVDQNENFPEEFRPGFGLFSNCWFSHRSAIFVFFAVPMLITMVANVVFFLTSAYWIKTVGSTISALQGKTPRRNCVVYSRLAVILGFTWIVGLIASYSDINWLKCMFVILNSAQGLFILLAFSRTTNVSAFLRVKAFAATRRFRNTNHQSPPDLLLHASRASRNTVIELLENTQQSSTASQNREINTL
ncbi:G-protein coupled receptor Mth2-like [Limulus polyphemus]|uniref:G-protein coupled receptor Mth2-like n=1 Tax=Limulus polyphemus TaxID=6850 RepID=A0ABM1BZB3_LIMPO|nr:G-protein coupled receptor Mth2-like [Limulus polyphemus]XP_013791522.1 G-protein coupled receptor Mth2-like [Limulus polyphemus]